SDDKDHYEQAYRLGHYCNAVVCVSTHLKRRITELNPALAAKTHVIYNSSVSAKQITKPRPTRGRRIRLIYSGRLVQYQNRILDFIQLAEALDRINAPYQINLAGSFSRRENIEQTFRTRARAHLADGRIQLIGRMSRDRLLQHLSHSDFFVLLSDFEGL